MSESSFRKPKAFVSQEREIAARPPEIHGTVRDLGDISTLYSPSSAMMQLSLNKLARCSVTNTVGVRHRADNRPCKRRALVVRAGLFDFLGGGASAGSSKADELVEELLTASRRAGNNPNQASKEEIAELALQLRKFRPRAPTKSSLFWGDYEVAFSSNPNATGGPILRSPPGKILFAGQKPRQSLQQPSTLVNTVQYKTLGLLPGTVTQNGELSILDGNRYEVDLEPVGRRGGEPITRRFEVLYLDDRVRVVQFLPEDEDREPSYFVFERLAEAIDMEEEEEEADEGSLPELPRNSGTWRTGRPKQSNQVEQLTADLKDWQEKSKATSQQLRESERGAGSTLRSARPARSQIDRALKEATELELQLAAAIEASRAADARYRQAVAALREVERAAK